jgi:hypothetical protein
VLNSDVVTDPRQTRKSDALSSGMPNGGDSGGSDVPTSNAEQGKAGSIVMSVGSSQIAERGSLALHSGDGTTVDAPVAQSSSRVALVRRAVVTCWSPVDKAAAFLAGLCHVRVQRIRCER